MVDLNSESGAIVSDDDRYRYLLWRNWFPNNRRRLLWIMLNPSTANACTNDPTIQRCIDFSKRENFGGLEVVNIFAYRTPYPGQLQKVKCPLGCMNDHHIREALGRAEAVVAAWGWRGLYLGRGTAVRGLLKQYAIGPVYCLGQTQNGSPRHPLYVNGNKCLEAF